MKPATTASRPKQARKNSPLGQDPTRVREIVKRLERTYPDAKCALRHSNPFQLLVATILSAQCTDERVNKVTLGLFQKYPTPHDFAALRQEVLEEEVRSTGFFRNKSKSILGAARKIVQDFGGKVPQTMEELLTLPGVARKTANVVLGNAYGVTEGIAVDTHVRRLVKRFGLTKHNDPVKIERDLMNLIPKRDWFKATYLFIEYGRKYCAAKPHAHNKCPLNKFDAETG